MIMCNVCCREFRGWCKSFTCAETLLSILGAILLIALFGFLIFLVLHFLACSKQDIPFNINSTDSEHQDYEGSPEDMQTIPSAQITKFPKSLDLTEYEDENESVKDSPSTAIYISRITISPDIECTWTPSKKTEARTHYYDLLTRISTKLTMQKQTTQELTTESTDETSPIITAMEGTDGEPADPTYKSFVLALVKLRPLRDIVFGCTLTIVAERWALTAASCIEAVEEADSLDAFVMLERFGEPEAGVAHAVADVQLHPFYRGADRSLDLAALRSDDSLLAHGGRAVALPALLDYALTTPGEMFTIIGFGKFRAVEQSGARGARAVRVWSTERARCAEAEAAAAAGADAGEWAARHLWGARAAGRAAAAGGAAARALCAAAAGGRRAPCNYCAGTPLLAAGALRGLMAAADGCGVACEPALYVNVAAAADWLDYLIGSD